jgi:hypothetical protein
MSAVFGADGQGNGSDRGGVSRCHRVPLRYVTEVRDPIGSKFFPLVLQVPEVSGALTQNSSPALAMSEASFGRDCSKFLPPYYKCRKFRRKGAKTLRPYDE